MRVETKMKVERAVAVLSPFEVAEAVANYIAKHSPGFDGWVVTRENVEIDDEGGARVAMERKAPDAE